MPDRTLADDAADRLLGLIQEGCPDAEIAVRLGSSIADIKARVERLMRTAGVEDRPALKAWATTPAVLLSRPNDGIVRQTALPAAKVQPRRRAKVMPVGRIASIAAAVLAPLVLIAVFVLWPASDRAGFLAAVPLPAFPDAQDAQDNPIPGRVARQVLPAPFPEGLVLYVLTGCASCDTAPTGIDRIWRDRSGAMHTETLFAAPETPGHYISTVWASPEGAQIAVGVCIRGWCGQRTRPGSAQRPTPDARVQVWRSDDGGISWAEAGTFDGSLRIFGQLVSDDAAAQLVVQGCTRAPGTFGCAMRLFPSGASVSNPGLYTDIPILAKEGVLRWQPAVLSSGLAGDVPGWPQPERSANFGMLAPKRWAMATYEPGLDSRVDTKLSLIDGSTLKLLDQVVISATTVSFGAWFRGTTAVVLVEQSPGSNGARTVAVVDMDAGVYQAITTPFTSGAYAGQLVSVLAARPGPVAVGPEEGACLPAMPVPAPVVPSGCLKPKEMAIVQTAAFYADVRWIGVRLDNGVFGLLPENEPHLRYVKPWVEPGGAAAR